MSLRKFCAVFVSCFVTLVVFAQGVDVPKASTQNEPSEQIQSYAKMLNEYSERRRLNTFFVNEQSPFLGVQSAYINTSAGNLTFLRRDLVRLSRLPVVMGRVYDSRIEENADFGPGWKIAPMEYLKRIDDKLQYTDASGSIYMLVQGESGFELQTPFYSDFLQVEMLDLGAVITNRSLWSRYFESTADGFRLSRVTDNHGNTIQYHYQDDWLSAISTEHGRITFQRDPDGRVTKISDDIERQVVYRYDDLRRLTEVVDLGGQSWVYRYDHNNRLVGIEDPNQHETLTVAFDPEGRVAHSIIRSQRFHYQYKGNKTTARDSDGAVSTFEYNPLGLTYRITSPAGLVTAVEFDEPSHPVAV